MTGMPEGTKDPDIIIYGGAFDPPHQGHIDSIDCLHRRFPHAEILVIPGKIPAGALGAHKIPAMRTTVIVIRPSHI